MLTAVVFPSQIRPPITPVNPLGFISYTRHDTISDGEFPPTLLNQIIQLGSIKLIEPVSRLSTATLSIPTPFTCHGRVVKSPVGCGFLRPKKMRFGVLLFITLINDRRNILIRDCVIVIIVNTKL